MRKKRNSNKKASHPFHDLTVNSLEKRLKRDDRLVLKEHKYNHRGDHEADILVFDENKRYAYAIEVKTTDHYKARKKARKQLWYDEKYIKEEFGIDRVFSFYIHRSNDSEKLYDINRFK